ncbi:MAG: NADPH-dependent glutamate synthase [Spirochaetes bacterium]|nr:NADPH-dependent glutamate synthase [Spirochaetota bacterium]
MSIEEKSVMQLEQVKIREQDPKERNRNFNEVCLGYIEEEAIKEALRCIECGQCMKGCPVQINIPGFIHLIKEKKHEEAYKMIKETNSLPGVCGRVCPQETQCEILCPLGKKGQPVAIGKLERFVADHAIKTKVKENIKIKSNHIKIAVVGSGPAGLTCAGELAKKGYEVTIFESFHLSGGVLRYGIPEFRLPRKILDNEIDHIKHLGVKIINNVLIGKSLTLDDLKKDEFKAVFIAVGAGLPTFMNIPGENLNGVVSANEFLTRNNLMLAFSEESHTPIRAVSPVIVVGGGNVAMDSARSAKRLGAKEVIVVYRRTEKEMPARVEEVHHAMEEGIEFHFLTNPVEILGDDKGWIKEVKCIKMELGEPDESGRRRPVPIKDSEFTIKTNTLIMSIGQKPNPLISQSLPELETTKWGTIVANDDMMTSIEGVFAGGDIVTGAATVIAAMEMGRKAADGIEKWISKK